MVVNSMVVEEGIHPIGGPDSKRDSGQKGIPHFLGASPREKRHIEATLGENGPQSALNLIDQMDLIHAAHCGGDRCRIGATDEMKLGPGEARPQCRKGWQGEDQVPERIGADHRDAPGP